MKDHHQDIHEIINRETQAWNEKSITLLLSVFHPDMVWVWPSDPKNSDPMSWETVMGKFNLERWTTSYEEWFSTFAITHNNRTTKKIVMTKENDGAFAIVDIDTLWTSKSGQTSHWIGRTCKTYTKTAEGWKMIAQVGVLDFKD